MPPAETPRTPPHIPVWPGQAATHQLTETQALTAARGFPGAGGPGLQMINLVVDLVNDLVERLHRVQLNLPMQFIRDHRLLIKSVDLEVGAALYVGEDERVEVHGSLVPVEGQLTASPARRVVANTRRIL